MVKFSEHLKSRVGLLMAGIYMLVFLLLLLDIALSKPDSMSGLALLFFTLPWSFSVMEAARNTPLVDGIPATFFFLITLCALVNAGILYCVGLILTQLISLFKK